MLNFVGRGRWRDTAQQGPRPGPAKHAFPLTQLPPPLTAAVAEGPNLVHLQGRFMASLKRVAFQQVLWVWQYKTISVIC